MATMATGWEPFSSESGSSDVPTTTESGDESSETIAESLDAESPTSDTDAAGMGPFGILLLVAAIAAIAAVVFGDG